MFLVGLYPFGSIERPRNQTVTIGVNPGTSELVAVIEVRGLEDLAWYEGPPSEEPGTGEFLGSWKKARGDMA